MTTSRVSDLNWFFNRKGAEELRKGRRVESAVLAHLSCAKPDRFPKPVRFDIVPGILPTHYSIPISLRYSGWFEDGKIEIIFSVSHTTHCSI